MSLAKFLTLWGFAQVRLAADLGVRPGEKVGLKRAVQVQCGSMHTLAMLQIGGRLAVIATGLPHKAVLSLAVLM